MVHGGSNNSSLFLKLLYCSRQFHALADSHLKFSCEFSSYTSSMFILNIFLTKRANNFHYLYLTVLYICENKVRKSVMSTISSTFMSTTAQIICIESNSLVANLFCHFCHNFNIQYVLALTDIDSSPSQVILVYDSSHDIMMIN